MQYFISSEGVRSACACYSLGGSAFAKRISKSQSFRMSGLQGSGWVLAQCYDGEKVTSLSLVMNQAALGTA